MSKPGANIENLSKIFSTNSNLEPTEIEPMRSLLTCCLLVTICLHAASQRVIDVNKEDIKSGALSYLVVGGGTPFVNAKFAKLVSGSPFFKEELMPGVLISANGTEYRNIIIRLNLLESQVNFLNNQVEMIVGTPLREVIIWDTVNNKSYRFVFSEHIETTDKPEKDFYELLETGRAQLYKQYKKIMREDRPYNSATYEQTIQTNIRYFVLIGGQWKKVAKIKDLLTVLADKKSEVQQHISAKRISGDSQEDFQAVISYYNSLFIQQQ